MKEPKVTECWAKLNQDGSPNVDWTIWRADPKNKNYVRVVAVKAEDYDAMRRELEELRECREKRYKDDLEGGL